ncbi:YhdB family protein [Lederbergia panacisoli]|uniref:YhdB family protein n=1 Tax=Lederbergia panacisoli TaxID=1255251 RepID=UPI00214B28BD|nr:YhdB family protein [Lederbergia panacisoli]MCR2821106.1 YhdB family protein [Lederbergia panacisoli]
MDTLDYDRALYYTHRSEWDNLIVLMVRTKDHMLSKRIERFLHSYQFSRDYTVIERNLYSLLRYLDHANHATAAFHTPQENPVLSI